MRSRTVIRSACYPIAQGDTPQGKTLFQPKSPKVLNNAGRLTKELNNTALHIYYHILPGKLMTLILEFMFFWSAPKKNHVNNSWVNMVTLPANALHIVRPSKFSGPIKHRRAAHCAQWQHASRRKKNAAEREGDAKNQAKWTPILLSFHHDVSRDTCIGSHLCLFSGSYQPCKKKTSGGCGVLPCSRPLLTSTKAQKWLLR